MGKERSRQGMVRYKGMQARYGTAEKEDRIVRIEREGGRACKGIEETERQRKIRHDKTQERVNEV